MKKYLFLIAALSLLCACKPTEKNYQAAYHKAYEAAQKRAEEEKKSSTGESMEALNGPRIEVVGTDTIYLVNGMGRVYTEPETGATGRVGIAVAQYRMPTNAKRHADDMKKEYPDAFVASDGDDNYYVVIKRVPSVEEALDPIRIFQSTHPDYRYIGLPGYPLGIYLSGK